MSIDLISSNQDADSLEKWSRPTERWNGYSVKQTVDGSALALFRSVQQHNPLMSSCSAGYKKNADGSWELRGEIVFKSNEAKSNKEQESSNENSAGQGTTAQDRDPPDSRDRADNR